MALVLIQRGNFVSTPISGHYYTDNLVVDLLTLYDSLNYKHIVTSGYAAEMLTPFFPLFPLVVKGITLLGINVYWAGVVLSNICFFLSLLLLNTLLLEQNLNTHIRSYILWFLALFPSSYFFSAFYAESFFLFLVLLSFWLWRNNHTKLAYLIGGLTSLTRLVGVSIPLAFFAEKVIQKKVNLTDVKYSFISFLIFCTYPLYLWVSYDNPLLFLQAQSYFPRRQGYLFEPIIIDILNVAREKKIDFLLLFHFIIIAMFFIYIINTLKQKIKVHKNKEWADIIFSIIMMTIPLCSVVELNIKIATHGIVRYILPVFPFFIFWGRKMFYLKKHRKLLYYLIVFLWFSFFIYMNFGFAYRAFMG